MQKREQLAEVAVAAKELDGAVDATLTTGSTLGADKGALYVAACGAAVKEASGLPVEVQLNRPTRVASTSSTGSTTWASTRSGSTSSPSILRSWPTSPRPRLAPASRATSQRGSWRSACLGKVRCLHLDSLASTVLQTCAYWGNDDQCRFCGIGLSLDAHRTIAKKRPEQLAEVAVAAKELDGAVDATLTTGSTLGADKGALYVAACGAAVKEASGLPVEVQFEPPDTGRLDVIDRVHDLGIDSVGIHVESFDPAVLAYIAPAKARTGIEGYFAAWERAVSLFGEGQVSTYVILGMGEDPQLTIDGCRRAIDMGVYPFVVPLRPIAGSLMEACRPPTADYTENVYRQVVPYLKARGLGAKGVAAGCARCQACSAMGAMEQALTIGTPRVAGASSSPS